MLTASLTRGVALDGLEYSGKTALAEALGSALEERGHPVSRAHGTMTDDDLVARLHSDQVAIFEERHDRAFDDPDLWSQFNSVRSAQLMIDAARLPARPSRDRIHVQDRYWLTQHCFNRQMTPGRGFLGDDWIERSAPRFTLQVWVTCSPETRRLRAAERGPKHAINAFLVRHLDEVIELDRVFCEHLVASGQGRVVSSEGRAPRELARAVLAEFDAADRGAP
ncbi:MAG: hypothetical protein EON52_07670 [Actinomycetales bacterium]|nr:MAG: hypothetical protein EON52_07670 [Actinomycetales bacterium]